MTEDASLGSSAEEAPAAPVSPPVATLVLCAASVLLYLGVAHGGSSWESLENWGYRHSDQVWDGAYWSLLWSALLHATLWHVAFNVYWLWVLGRVLEGTLGTLAYLGLVIAAAITSSSAQLAVSGDTGIGASGVVYSIFGLLWVARKKVPSFAAVLGENVAPLFWLWLVGCIVATQAGVLHIGNTAHAAGLVLGLVAGLWLPPGVPRRTSAIIGTVALVVLSLVPLAWSPWSARWVGHHAYLAHLDDDYESAIAGYRQSIALGGDAVWALSNIAYAYDAIGDSQSVASVIGEIRAVDAEAALEIEAELAAPLEGDEPRQ